MSIVTLKRKTNTQYNNMSVGSTHGFSLNGTHRNQGFVGQTSLSRSLPKTLMKGNTVRGHGGCCGTYNNARIVQSAVTSLEDANVVKPSVVSTFGMLSSKYKWVRRPDPYAVVKPDSTLNSNSQGEYVHARSKKAMFIADSNRISSRKSNTAAINEILKNETTCSANYDAYHRTVLKLYTKPQSDYLPVSSGEHIRKLNNACTENQIFNVQRNTQGEPFGSSI